MGLVTCRMVPAPAEKARATTKMATLIVIYSLCSSSLLIINKVGVYC